MLFIMFLVALAASLAGAAMLGSALYTRRLGWAGLGALIGVIAILAIAGVYWEHAILALAISSIVFLAIGVVLQKVDPVKALGGALASLVLFFVFTWLAVQMADALFFAKEDGLRKLLREPWSFSLDRFAVPWIDGSTEIALGIACLAAAGFFGRAIKAVLIFTGLVLIALQAPNVLRGMEWVTEFYPLFNEPLVKLCLAFLLLAFVIRLVRQSFEQGATEKSADSPEKFHVKDKERGP